MKTVFHSIIKDFDKKRLTGILLSVSLFLLMPMKMMITSNIGVQVAYEMISDGDDNLIAVEKNSYENNSMISLLKFRF